MVESIDEYKKRLRANKVPVDSLIELAHKQATELEVLRELFSEMAYKFDYIRNYREKQTELAKEFESSRTFNEADLEAIEKIAGEFYEELADIVSDAKR